MRAYLRHGSEEAARNRKEAQKDRQEMRAYFQKVIEKADADRRETREYFQKVIANAEADRKEMRAFFQTVAAQAADDRADFKADRANFAKLTAMVVKIGNEIIRRLEDIQRTLYIQGNGRRNR
ncbi:MAG: hypothetical protein HY716_12180 [Planctomycetes bacterium]|nr:hypothetical protein [Planctomycetota bacterium]